MVAIPLLQKSFVYTEHKFYVIIFPEKNQFINLYKRI